MSFSSGTFSLYTPGNPVITGTTISSDAFNNTMNDIATGLSTCILKDGSQTVTANIPMGGFKFTGLAAGTANGNSVRYEQSPAGILTTTGDTLYASAANTPARLAVGAAGAISMVASGLPSWLAIGTARQQLATNAGATAAEWVASLQSLMTGTGDIVQSSSANTPARLAIGTARQVPTVNAGATALAYGNPITLGTMQATTSGTAFNYTSLPAGIRRITVHFVGVSLSGTDNILVQIGDTNGVSATGYVSSGGGIANAGASVVVSSTAGFIVLAANAASVFSGTMTLDLVDAATFQWTASHAGKTNTTGTLMGGGDKALAAVFDRLTITRTGTDTFDAGAVNISYE